MNTKKMITTSIFLIFIGVIISAIGGFLYNTYSTASTDNAFKDATDERVEMKNKLNQEFQNAREEMRLHKDSLNKKVEDEANEIISQLKIKSEEAQNALEKLKDQSTKATIEITNELSKLKENVIENNSIESALNSEIKNLTLLLHLKKELKPDNYIREGFLIRMRSSQMASDESFKALFVVHEAGNHNGTVWMLGATTFTLSEYQSGIKTGYAKGTYENSLKMLPFPLSLKSSKNKPLTIVRDLDEWDIELFLPEEISKFAKKVQLVVNSGYQFKKYITVFDKETTENDWESTEYKINNNFKREEMNLMLKYVRNKTGIENRWQIDISKSTIENTENTSPDTREEF